MKSLRVRLSITLLLAALLAAVLLGMITYRHTLAENEALFDYQLRQTALSLRDQGVVPNRPGMGPEDEGMEVVVQIWTMNGTILYLSHPWAVLPDRATLGFSDVNAGGRRWRVYTMMAHNRVIQVAQPFEIRRDLAANAAWHSLSPLLIFAPLMALLIWFLVGRALRPLRRLEREVTQRDAATLDAVSEQDLPSEIAPVAYALNSLLARLKRAFAVQRAFVADAAHELRSPLTALKLQLQLLDRAPDAQARAGAMAKLHEGVDRASRLIEQLLVAARSEAAGETRSMQQVNLAELMRLAIAEMFPLAQAKRIAIDFDAPEELHLIADAEGLKTLMRNLLDNAIRYTPAGGTVHAAAAADGQGATLMVEDSGPGIAESERERVFQRFYRGMATEQEGSGLGLAIVKNVVDQHRATIQLGTSSLGGLRIAIHFP